MPRNIKIFISVLFVIAVAFFVVRGCAHKKAAPVKPAVMRPIVKKPIVKKKVKPVTKPKMVRGPGVVSGKGGRMAIILDDWGLKPELVDDAQAIGRPITLAVLPHLEFSRDIAANAHAAGLGVMLHMPMEPKSKYQPLEPETIRTTANDEEILRYLNRALAAVPYVQGVNNHMGSAATSDPRVMRVMLKRLKEKGLFFVDSNTIATTVAPRVADELGVASTRRDVFLDNVNESAAIREQLRKAIKIANTTGECIVIGHDRAVTLRAIKEMVPEFDEAGVKLVYAKDIVA